MKKSICFVLILSMIFGAVFAQSMKATVVSVSGKVERQVGDNWVPLNTGDSISAGTMISTGFKSTCTVRFDNSVLELAPLSRLTLSELVNQEDSRDSSVYLDAGKITANIKSSDNKRVNFTVNSPVATASVRGTAGSVDCAGNVESTESTWAVCSVDSSGKAVGNPVPVSEGMKTQVSSESGEVKSPVAVTVASNAGASSLMAPSTNSAAADFGAQSFASDVIKAVTGGDAGSNAGCSLSVEIVFED